MDTSKEYIKMADNPDIQGLFNRVERLDKDYFVAKDYIDNAKKEVNYRTVQISNIHDCTIDLIWLPRQDQLQEMVDWGTSFTNADINFDVWKKDNVLLNYRSRKQLWLAFVMKEKFNKQWVDGKWVLIK